DFHVTGVQTCALPICGRGQHAAGDPAERGDVVRRTDVALGRAGDAVRRACGAASGPVRERPNGFPPRAVVAQHPAAVQHRHRRTAARRARRREGDGRVEAGSRAWRLRIGAGARAARLRNDDAAPRRAGSLRDAGRLFFAQALPPGRIAVALSADCRPHRAARQGTTPPPTVRTAPPVSPDATGLASTAARPRRPERLTPTAGSPSSSPPPSPPPAPAPRRLPPAPPGACPATRPPPPPSPAARAPPASRPGRRSSSASA